MIPVAPQLEALLRERHGKREPKCPYVCFRFDRRGHAVRIGGLRKVWESRCVAVGLGEMVELTDRLTGETLYGKPRTDRKNAKPKPKMTYVGLTFHDLRRSAVSPKLPSENSLPSVMSSVTRPVEIIPGHRDHHSGPGDK